MKKRLLYSSLLITSIFISCTNSKSASSLKEAYKPYFNIGTAVNSKHLDESDYEGRFLIKKQFNAITPENVLKWQLVHPEKDKYYFDEPDKFVAMGEKDNSFIVGHTLVWHSQLANYVTDINNPQLLEEAIKEHIKTVMGKYKGRIDAWDVVNEALNDDGTLRTSHFYNVLGEKYIEIAFQYASEIDPNCDLYYNDYNMIMKDKRAGAIKLIKNLKDKGIRIDGVGMQGHWNLNWPSLEEIEQSIIDYSNAGVKVMITELDLTVLPNPWDLKGADVNQNFAGSPFMNPYPDYLPDSVETALAKRYEDIFKIFLKHHDKISRVTFWGVQDGDSWLNGWPISGRTNYPLLFNRKYKKKKAYKAVMNQAALFTEQNQK